MIEQNVMERNFATYVIANEEKLSSFGGGKSGGYPDLMLIDVGRQSVSVCPGCGEWVVGGLAAA